MNANEIVELLKTLSSGDFADIFYAAMGGREERAHDEPISVGSKLVLAKVGWSEEGGPVGLIEIVCPTPDFGFGRADLEESGQCDRCKNYICSSVNEAYCPICGTYNELT
jgi:hypothetical protein